MDEKGKINIYFDMDGVPAVYGFEDSIEKMQRPGYFATRPAQENVIQLVRQLRQDELFEVHFLSAVFDDDHSVWDKLIWLHEHGLSDVDTIFVPCNVDKAEYIRPSAMNILVDDFTRNLLAWEANGESFMGIKFDNGGNGKKGTWRARQGLTLSRDMSAEELYRSICVMSMMRTAVA